jgi:hypothetical protein
MPALITLDQVNKDVAKIPLDVCNELRKIYFNYFNSGIYDALYYDFKSDINEVLTKNKIVFFWKNFRII